jgi:hypothetical protein
VTYGVAVVMVLQCVPVSVAHVDVDLVGSSLPVGEPSVLQLTVQSLPQLAVHVGLGGPLEKCVVGLDLSGGQLMEKMPSTLKQGAEGMGGGEGSRGIGILGAVGRGTGDQ